MRENGPLLSREFFRPAQKHLLSRVEPRPGTKGPFVPGGGCTRDKRPPFLSRVVAPPGTKGVFGRAGKIPSPRPTFSPGWIDHPGQNGPFSLVPA